MQKTITSSCYDAIIIKQQNRVYKSTPFQVVFSSTLIKQIDKNKMKGNKPYTLQLFVNQREVDIPMKIDATGRVVFEKRFNRKLSAMVSDSSDVSDDDYSQKSSTIDSHISKSKGKDRLEEYKNEQAPAKFWQFAWLFSQKKDSKHHAPKIQEQEQLDKIQLSKIKEEIYEGEAHCKEPLFHLSLCGNLLKKKETKEDILKAFYENRIEYSTFIKDPPTYLNDSNLVVKIDDSIYTWQLGITILTCRYAYGKELSKDEIEDIIKNKFTKNKLLTFISGPGITKLDIKEVQKEKQKSNDIQKFEKGDRPVVKYRKTPDSQKIRKMKLKYGKNVAKFVLDCGNDAKEEITMKVFLWDDHEKIVISDIDGTITKSDILGQILSKWIHPGVTRLFMQIAKRNYKIIYLTARAIGQYHQTEKFLSSAEQQGVLLPEGPLMMSPDGYYRSFTRQVIYKTPDYLKTKILASLNEVFPNSKNPIYCGFGNRETDSTAYLKINISPDRIFNINEKSIITKESDKQFTSTYLDMLENVNEHFPEYFKDHEMVESSSDSERVYEFEAVGLNDSSNNLIKNSKTKSLQIDPGDSLLDGFEESQLDLIGSLSRNRKSEHQISNEDLMRPLENLPINEEKAKEEYEKASQPSEKSAKIQETQNQTPSKREENEKSEQKDETFTEGKQEQVKKEQFEQRQEAQDLESKGEENKKEEEESEGKGTRLNEE